MKKLIALFLALVMVFALCACGGKTEPPKTDTPNSGSSGSGTTGSGSPTKTDAPKTTDPPPAATPEPAKEDEYITMRVGYPGDMGDLMTSGLQGDCHMAIDCIFDYIFFIDPVTKEWTSDVLEDWYMEDEHHMVMKMHDNIYFSNGDHATAEDLLFSYLCHLQDGNDHWIDVMKIIPDECTVRDEFTAVLALEAKVQDLYSRDNILLDKKWVDQVGYDNPEAWYYPVGSGPYYVVENNPNDHITLRLRDDYWARPKSDFYVEEWIITQYADTATAYMALEIGDIDFCRIAKTEYARVANEGADLGLDVTKVPVGTITSFYMPAHINSVWEDKRVREAVAVGVDWVELDKIMYGDLTQPATSVTPTDSPVYINPGTRTFDVEKAKALLAEAGYAPGDIKLQTSLFDTALNKAFGEAFKFYMNQIGIEADITFSDVATVLAVWNSGKDTDFAIHNYPAGSPGRNICQAIPGITGMNVSFTEVKNERLQELWNQLAPLYDAPVSEKLAIATELQQLIFDEILLIPVHEDVSCVAFNSEILSRDILQKYVVSDAIVKAAGMSLRSNWA